MTLKKPFPLFFMYPQNNLDSEYYVVESQNVKWLHDRSNLSGWDLSKHVWLQFKQKDIPSVMST